MIPRNNSHIFLILFLFLSWISCSYDLEIENRDYEAENRERKNYGQREITSPDQKVYELSSSDHSKCYPLMLCGDKCVDLTTDSNNCGECGKKCYYNGYCTRGYCFDGKCYFSPGCPLAECNCVIPHTRVCTNHNFDNKHCGKCNNPCKEGETCIQGKCRPVKEKHTEQNPHELRNEVIPD